MELDPDAKPPPPPEPPPLPPVQEGDWGVGGKDEEGKFAPSGKTGAKKREEEEAAEAAKAEDYRTIPSRDLGFDMVIGFGTIRDLRSNTNPTKTTVASFVPYFAWRVNETWAFGLRVPVSTGSVDGPVDNQDDYSVSALGDVEAWLGATFKLRRRMRLPVSVALGLPTAQGDLYPEATDAGAKPRALLNQAAAASRGWEELSLFLPNRFGITPRVGFSYETRVLHFMASTKLELLVRTGGGDPATEKDGILIDPAVNWVTGASFFYDFFDGLVSPGLRAWLSVSKQPAKTPTTDYSGAQFVIEPDVNSTYRLNKDTVLRGGIGFIVPLGGPVGGGASSSIDGFRLNAAFTF